MTDQKHEDTATAEGMPEVVVHAPPPPVDNDHVAPGAEQFDPPPPHVQSTTPLEVEVLHLRERLHEMEETVHTFLTHQTSVGHDRITSWLTKVKERIASSIQPAPRETSPPSAPSDTEPTGKSTS